jgi:hypothetical protein
MQVRPRPAGPRCDVTACHPTSHLRADRRSRSNQGMSATTVRPMALRGRRLHCYLPKASPSTMHWRDRLQSGLPRRAAERKRMEIEEGRNEPSWHGRGLVLVRTLPDRSIRANHQTPPSRRQQVTMGRLQVKVAIIPTAGTGIGRETVRARRREDRAASAVQTQCCSARQTADATARRERRWPTRPTEPVTLVTLTARDRNLVCARQRTRWRRGG